MAEPVHFLDQCISHTFGGSDAGFCNYTSKYLVTMYWPVHRHREVPVNPKDIVIEWEPFYQEIMLLKGHCSSI
ncbi:MAG: hypothetical protein ACOC6F_03545 [bacterium]